MPGPVDYQHCARCGHRMFIDAIDGRGRYVEYACLRCGARRYLDAGSGRLQLPERGSVRLRRYQRKPELAAMVTDRVRRFRERERERERMRKAG